MTPSLTLKPVFITSSFCQVGQAGLLTRQVAMQAKQISAFITRSWVSNRHRLFRNRDAFCEVDKKLFGLFRSGIRLDALLEQMQTLG